MRSPHPVALLLGLSVVVAACGVSRPTLSPAATPGPPQSGRPSSSPFPTATASPSPSPAATVTATPEPGADIAVVRIEQTGGMLAPWVTINRYPAVAVYGDGRLIKLGPQVEIFPAPALPNLQVTELTDAGVDQILEWASDAGLEGEDRFLGDVLPDAPVTTFTVNRLDGGPQHVTSVSDTSSSDPETTAVRRFEQLLLSIREWLPDQAVVGDDQPYAWGSLQLVVSPADPNTVPDPTLVKINDWPLEDLATAGIAMDEVSGYRCGLVEGADVDTLRPLLATATELTLWQSGGQLWAVQFHPLLPDEGACAGFAG